MKTKIFADTTEEKVQEFKEGRKTGYIQVDRIILRTGTNEFNKKIHEFEIKDVGVVEDREKEVMLIRRFPDEGFKKETPTIMLAIGKEIGNSIDEGKDPEKHKEIFRLIIRKLREEWSNNQIRDIINIKEFVKRKREFANRTIEDDIRTFLPPAHLMLGFNQEMKEYMIEETILNKIRTQIIVCGVNESWVN